MSRPTGEDFDLLARAHMARQVHEAAATQVLVGRYWDRLVDPHDLDASFERFQATATKVVSASRTTSERTAQAYYQGVRDLAGFDGSAPTIPRQPLDEEATTRSLYSVGYGAVKRRIDEGLDAPTAVAQARAGVLGTAKRHTLAAGRQRLIDLGNADDAVVGWARVSDGKPCAFCAMLIGRGPVYHANTVGFRAHDGCGCNVRLVPAKHRDPADGWAPDARAFGALAAHVGLDVLTTAGLVAFRAAYTAALGDTSSSVAKAVATAAAGTATASAIRASTLALAA